MKKLMLNNNRYYDYFKFKCVFHFKELPPNVAKEPERVDDQIDIPIAPKDSNDSKEGKNY